MVKKLNDLWQRATKRPTTNKQIKDITMEGQQRLFRVVEQGILVSE
jgi:hypothetical protein